MAVLWLPFLGLAAVVYLGSSSGERGNFPLDVCSTAEIDLLFLYTKGDLNTLFTDCNQKLWAVYLVYDLMEHNEANTRIRFADESSMSFSAEIQDVRCSDDLLPPNMKHNVTEDLVQKIQSVKRLFAEMGGVRENATHVAVVFLEGHYLSFEESRRVPDILQQQDTDIKILVVVCCLQFETHVTYLKDTLLVGYYDQSFSEDVLMMSICNKCPLGSFPWKLSHNAQPVSCYFIEDSGKKTDAETGMAQCKGRGGWLATIETREELEMLQANIISYFKNNNGSLSYSMTSLPVTGQLFIGLVKNSTNFGKKFHWSLGELGLARPLVVQKWLPGKPGGVCNNCGVWQFIWNDARSNVTSVPSMGAGSDVTSVPSIVARSDVTSVPSIVARSDVTNAPSIVARSDVTSIPSMGARSDVTSVPSMGAGSDVTSVPSIVARSDATSVPSMGARSDVTSVPSMGAGSDVTSVPSMGARSDVTSVPSIGARSKVTSVPSMGARSDVTSVPSMGARSKVTSVPSMGARSKVTSVPSTAAPFIDGWLDVDCKDAVSSLSLCEVTFPRRFDEDKFFRIKPAENKSFSEALARGNFTIYKTNIISVSANVARLDFVEDLKKAGDLFPIFDCGVGIPDPRYISYWYVCDGLDHCSNRRDEMLCGSSLSYRKGRKEVEGKCRGVRCCEGSCLPLQRVGDGVVDCDVCGGISNHKVSDESEALLRSRKLNESCALFCNDDDGCVRFSQLNDGKRDCTGPEGPLDETVGKLETVDTCRNILGHRVWAPRCVYVKDRHGAILGCRDMSNLVDCVDFECPEGYSKCPDTYCIPQHYVLDGTADCPAGEEEEVNILSYCTGNFACWDSKVCLHPDLVCDGHPDCPHQDDEVDCHVTCPEGLRCISGTVTKSDYSGLVDGFDFYETDQRTRYLRLLGFTFIPPYVIYNQYSVQLEKIIVAIFSGCSIDSLFSFFSSTDTLQELDLSYNSIMTLKDTGSLSPPFGNLRHLNLSHNGKLFELSDFAFPFLETLDLAYTSLSQLEDNFFQLFPSLKHLNLSFTKITNIHKNTFPSRLILLTIDLRGLALKAFREDLFNGLTVSQDLYTDSFELCCPQIRGPNIPDHACHAPDNAISSCSDLVGVDVQRVLLWVVAVLAVLGNMTVIVYRVIWDRSVLRTGYGLFVTNLGISDFIMGVYLLIIAGADYYYRGVYVLSDKSWREGGVCRLSGLLATLSCETSTFFVFLITLDRFLVMKFPFGEIKFNKVAKMIALILSWVIGFLLALTPIVFQFEIYSSNAMCLGLPLTTERLKGWEFSFAVFIVLNFCLFLFIVYGQRAIFRAMSENRQSQTESRRAQDITVAKQLSLVALSNFFCWFPVGFMGFLSLSGHEISNDVYAWTTVIVLPINSAANPLLYTIPALMAKWERFKHGETRPPQPAS